MSFLISGTADMISSNLNWLNSNIQQIPVVGTVYASSIDNIVLPLGDNTYKVANFAASYFKRFYHFAESKIRHHPWLFGAIFITSSAITLKALVQYFKKTPPSNQGQPSVGNTLPHST